jgi:GT2 family glycosyltransferase
MFRVSYVITLFNKERYLPAVCAGLAAQNTIPNSAAEYIFVDDGSTDGTLPLLTTLTQGWANVRVIRQPNQGPAIALNAGLAAVQGAFVKLLDGDDVLLPWATVRLCDALESTGAHAACALPLLQGRYSVESDLLSIFDRPEPALLPVRRWDMLPSTLHRAQTNPSVWLIRREALTAIGGCDPAVFIQDYSLELRLALFGPIALVEGPVVAYPDTAPGRLSEDQAQTLYDLNLALLRFLRDNREIPETYRQAAVRRAAGRTWLWARRNAGLALSVAALARYGRALLGQLAVNEATESALCRPFRLGRSLRISHITPQAGATRQGVRRAA